MIIKVLFILLLIPFAGHAQIQKDKLEGSWKYTSYADSLETYAPGKQGEGLREFTFKEDGRVLYSQCTDMCGCLAETYFGSFSWQGKRLRLEFTELAPPFTADKSEYEQVNAVCTIEVKKLTDSSFVIMRFSISK